jgi:PhnB protein
MHIPKSHQVLMPYLIVNDGAGFASFASQVFNAEQTFLRFREDNKTIMHSEIQINGSTIMFCEATDNLEPAPANIFLYVDDADISFQKGLKGGAVSVMDPAEQDYGYACGIKDPFGNVWWITSIK